MRSLFTDSLVELITLINELEGPAKFFEIARLRALTLGGRYELGQPIVYHHLHKTGGTSFNRALASLTPLYCHAGGGLSPAHAKRLIAVGLRSDQIIAGHADTGVILPFLGKARLMTVIRKPMSQVISLYLWRRRHVRYTDHNLARALNLRDYLLQRPYNAVFQTASLHVGIERTPLTRTEDLFDRVPMVHAHLDGMHKVGVTENLQEMADSLAQDFNRPAPILARQLETKMLPARRAELEEQFADAERHPAIAHLFEIDRALYEKAKGLSARLAPAQPM
jgi:hypothetical protein